MAQLQLQSRKKIAYFISFLESSRNRKNNSRNILNFFKILWSKWSHQSTQSHLLGVCPLCWSEAMWKIMFSCQRYEKPGKRPRDKNSSRILFNHTMAVSKQTWPRLLNDTSCSPNGKRTREKILLQAHSFRAVSVVKTQYNIPVVWEKG